MLLQGAQDTSGSETSHAYLLFGNRSGRKGHQGRSAKTLRGLFFRRQYRRGLKWKNAEPAAQRSFLFEGECFLGEGWTFPHWVLISGVGCSKFPFCGRTSGQIDYMHGRGGATKPSTAAILFRGEVFVLLRVSRGIPTSFLPTERGVLPQWTMATCLAVGKPCGEAMAVAKSYGAMVECFVFASPFRTSETQQCVLDS